MPLSPEALPGPPEILPSARRALGADRLRAPLPSGLVPDTTGADPGWPMTSYSARPLPDTSPDNQQAH